MQVVLYEFSVRLFSFVQTKTVYRYGCMYFLAALVLVCIDVKVMSSAKAKSQPVLRVEICLQCNC